MEFDMGFTLELPEALGRKFKATIPIHQRSRFVAKLLVSRLETVENSLERAAKKANTFTRLNAEMKDWRALTFPY